MTTLQIPSHHEQLSKIKEAIEFILQNPKIEPKCAMTLYDCVYNYTISCDKNLDELIQSLIEYNEQFKG